MGVKKIKQLLNCLKLACAGPGQLLKFVFKDMSASYHFHYEWLKLELAQDMRVTFKCTCVFCSVLLSTHGFIYSLGFFLKKTTLHLFLRKDVIISVLFWLCPTKVYTIFSLSSFLLLDGFLMIQDWVSANCRTSCSVWGNRNICRTRDTISLRKGFKKIHHNHLPWTSNLEM